MVVAAVVAPVLRALAVPVPALLAWAHRPGWEARVVPERQVPQLALVPELQVPQLVLVPEVPDAEVRSAAVVELPSSPSSSLAVVTRSASGATGPL